MLFISYIALRAGQQTNKIILSLMACIMESERIILWLLFVDRFFHGPTALICVCRVTQEGFILVSLGPEGIPEGPVDESFRPPGE